MTGEIPRHPVSPVCPPGTHQVHTLLSVFLPVDTPQRPGLCSQTGCNATSVIEYPALATGDSPPPLKGGGAGPGRKGPTLTCRQDPHPALQSTPPHCPPSSLGPLSVLAPPTHPFSACTAVGWAAMKSPDPYKPMERCRIPCRYGGTLNCQPPFTWAGAGSGVQVRQNSPGAGEFWAVTAVNKWALRRSSGRARGETKGCLASLK